MKSRNAVLSAVLLALVAAAGCKTTDMAGWTRGTVRYIDLEGGFYAIEGDDGGRYDPIGLDEAYQEDGLRIRFKYEERPGLVGFHQWGRIVEVTELERLE